MYFNKQMGIISAVVSINKSENGSKVYSVVSMKYKESEKAKQMYKQDSYYEWQLNYKNYFSTENLVRLIKNSKNEVFINVDINSKNEIVGKGASLTRFKDVNNKEIQYVILSKLINTDDKTIGYKVAGSNGVVTNIPLKDLISYSLRAERKGLEFPVQNAAFNKSKENPLESSFYSAYHETPFFEERIYSGKKVTKVNRATLPNKQNTEEIVKLADDNCKQTSNENPEVKPKMTDIFTKEQLWQIYQGKNNGVDFRVYANPSLSAKQMQVLRNGLEAKVKPSAIRMIAFPEFKAECMLAYVTDLKNGLDIRKYLNPKFSISQLYRYAEAVELGLNIDILLEKDYTANQLSDILLREKNKVYKEFN